MLYNNVIAIRLTLCRRGEIFNCMLFEKFLKLGEDLFTYNNFILIFC